LAAFAAFFAALAALPFAIRSPRLISVAVIQTPSLSAHRGRPH
jgi:hypothetical protein